MARVQTSDLAGFTEGDHLKRIRGVLMNTRQVLEGIGALITRQSGDAFDAQRMGKHQWPARMNPNVPGIIADFAKGRAAPPERRFTDRPVLHDTGALAASVTWRVVGTSTVEVGSNLPYANVLHAGGTSHSEIITREVQGRLYKWMKRTKNAAKRAGAAPENRAKREASARVREDRRITSWKATVKAINAQLKARRDTKKSLKGKSKTAFHASAIKPLLARKKDIQARIKARTAKLKTLRVSATKEERAKIESKSARSDVAMQLGWLLSKKFRNTRLEINHPARPIVGIPAMLVRDIERLIGVTIRVTR